MVKQLAMGLQFQTQNLHIHELTCAVIDLLLMQQAHKNLEATWPHWDWRFLHAGRSVAQSSACMTVLLHDVSS